MKQRFYKILVVCFLLVGMSPVLAQSLERSLAHKQLGPLVFSSVNHSAKGTWHNITADSVKRVIGVHYSPAPLMIRKDHYILNFGFFCRKEWQIESKTRLPLRLRLGSLAYCNYLEGRN